MLVLVAKAPDLLQTIRGLLPKANKVVHAGDPDGEGKRPVDEVLDHLGYRGPVERLLISDLIPPAVPPYVGLSRAARDVCDPGRLLGTGARQFRLRFVRKVLPVRHSVKDGRRCREILWRRGSRK